VSCDDPDNLCTGDRCVIETLTVATPCDVDFGNRTLEIAGTVTVPDGGTLSFTATTIQMHGRLDGRNLGSGGNGAALTLNGHHDVDLHGKIYADGDAAGGSITVAAANDLRSKGKSARE
jgi:hypothetical protein